MFPVLARDLYLRVIRNYKKPTVLIHEAETRLRRPKTKCHWPNFRPVESPQSLLSQYKEVELSIDISIEKPTVQIIEEVVLVE